MSYKSIWDNGSWNVICDECGRKFKNSELQMRWDGLMVCSRDWEPRQPQDFVHGVADKQVPPFTRPEQSDSFIIIPIPSNSSVLNSFAINNFGINT
jgi:hypothetical protein